MSNFSVSRDVFIYTCLFRALKDAEKAISLAKDWPKGYFRQGRALAGLKVSFSGCFCLVLAHVALLHNVRYCDLLMPVHKHYCRTPTRPHFS